MTDDTLVEDFIHAGHHLRVTVWKSGFFWKWSYVIDGLHKAEITTRPFKEKMDSMNEGIFIAKYQAEKMPPPDNV
ncbi:hypothetical protein [Silvimonas amylolytica]|uniref:Uncharacterized protein n=1 Tax=Silvimonas amylolytica TaxID=449663 RepID=A0ABQ2PHR5_9NEIS|nr:hypothetical protein [Silvimonas amylolytica]GGP24850.1 hypothetical protein GCM10010971_06690 [Silvimonas amylolytica]